MAVERFSRRRSATHKQPHGLCPPVELITLRGLPYTSNFVQQHNELYTFWLVSPASYPNSEQNTAFYICDDEHHSLLTQTIRSSITVTDF